MSNIPFISFYPGKWLGRTAKLSAIERGIYITLICEMYESLEPLEKDHKRLARLCATTPKTFDKAIKILLKTRNTIIEADAGYWNDRVEKEIKTAQKKSEKARNSSQSRWGNTQQNQQNCDANASPMTCYPKKEPEEKDKSFSSARVRGKKSFREELREEYADV